MSRVGSLAILALVACGGGGSEPLGPPDGEGVGDASTGVAPRCGHDETVPDGVRVEGSTISVACDATTLTITTFYDGVARLRYGNAPAPLVPLTLPARGTARVGRRGDALVICGNGLELTVAARTCALAARDGLGRLLFEDAAWSTRGGDATLARKIEKDERVYGLGLHTAKGIDLRGETIELWNTDAYVDAHGGYPPDAPHLYQSIPFYVGLRDGYAYGVLNHDTHRTKFEVGAAAAPDMLRTTARAIDQYLFAGPSFADVLRRYTGMTGRMPMPAPWAIGFHQSRWEGPCEGSPASKPFCSAAQILEVAKTFRAKRIPADGLFLDIQHMRGLRSFTFDPDRFAAPETLFGELSALGFHAHAIVDPGIKIDADWDLYKAGVAGGHFLPYEGEVWPGPSVFPDFSAEKTRRWWAELSRGLVERGLGGLWIDMNEPANFKGGTIPNDIPCDGNGRATTMAELHNVYAYFEAQATYEGMKAKIARPFVLTRAAFAGSQKYAAAWTGDAPSTWATLSKTLPMLLSLGVSGMTFSGSDVGGYSGRAESTAELFARWMALGSVSPFFRAHAERQARRQEPWAFGPDAEDASRSAIGLRYELAPYLYSLFHEASATGAPILRPLVYEFQGDVRTHKLSDQAMLGPSLLVAPILTSGAHKRALYLPAGTWYELRSGVRFAGGATIELSTEPEPLPFEALPTFVREGAIVPRTERMAFMGEKPNAPLFLDVYPGARESSFVLYEDNGDAASSRTTLTLEPTAVGARLTAKREGVYDARHEKLVVRLRGADRGVKGAKLDGKDVTAVYDAEDRTIVVDVDRSSFTLELAYDKAPADAGVVKIPLRVQLPPGTDAATPIHVASSAWGWTHRPLERAGDVATGTLEVPRGQWFFFKITRGGWPTVEKDVACAERSNRHAMGAAGALAIDVAAWADRCP